jgi:tetratricopeptide (TPR) repeat protein
VLEAVLARDPSHENSRELLDKILADNKVEDPSPAKADIDLRIAQLEEAKKQRLLDAVYRGLDNLEKEPLTPDQMESVYILRGETFAMDSEFDRAEHIFSQVLEANPHSGRAMSGLGAIALGREQLTSAEQWFNKALLQTDRKDIALTGLGLCSQWQSKADAAWEYYLKALAINPENEQALYGAVQIGMLRREFALVERCLRGFLDLRPANLDHLYSLAGCLYAQQKFLDALDELEKLLLFEPSHANSIELKAIILSRKDVVVNNSANNQTSY